MQVVLHNGSKLLLLLLLNNSVPASLFASMCTIKTDSTVCGSGL